MKDDELESVLADNQDSSVPTNPPPPMLKTWLDDDHQKALRDVTRVMNVKLGRSYSEQEVLHLAVCLWYSQVVMQDDALLKTLCAGSLESLEVLLSCPQVQAIFTKIAKEVQTDVSDRLDDVKDDVRSIMSDPKSCPH